VILCATGRRYYGHWIRAVSFGTLGEWHSLDLRRVAKLAGIVDSRELEILVSKVA
jgi:hypothetical protein